MITIILLMKGKYGIVGNKIYFEKGEKRQIKNTKNVHMHNIQFLVRQTFIHAKNHPRSTARHLKIDR